MMKRILTLSLFLVFVVALFAQQKMSPNARYMLSSLKRSSVNTRSFVLRDNGTQKSANAYIHLHAGADWKVIEECGAKINAVYEDIVTANIPVDKIEQLSRLKEIKYIQLGMPVRKLMDKARAATLADKNIAGTDLDFPFLGKDVIVGIVDMGFEYGHPNFYTSDRKELRIKRVWEQGYASNNNAPEGFNYGRELTTEDDILAARFDGIGTHGTHVTGIAAGADTTNNSYYGIAGEADIVLVSLGSAENDPENVTVSDGVKYVCDYAESVGKPCVINLSLGTHAGPHDGTSSFDMICDRLQGEGKLLVGASGNEGSDSFHLSKTFDDSYALDSLSSFVKFGSIYNPISEIDVWGEVGMKYAVQLYVYNKTTQKRRYTFEKIDVSLEEGADKDFSLISNVMGAAGTISVYTEINPLNKKAHANIYIDLTSLPSSSIIGFTITPLTPGTIHAWADDIYSTLSNYKIAGYTNGDNKSSMGEIGGSGKRIVTVGAYVSKNSYKDFNGQMRTTGETVNNIASFSSLGPTPDGRIKPDITAPGSIIASSISSNDGNLKSRIIANKGEWNNKTYYYAMMDGTSMATPCVVGILATWLQANKKLTPEDVREIFKKTAIKKVSSGQLPEEGDNTWGYGKIDAWNGLKESIRMANGMGIDSETLTEPLYILPSERGFNLLFTKTSANTNIFIYDMNGRMVYTQVLNQAEAGDEINVALPHLDKGVYVIKAVGDQLNVNSKLTLK